MGSWRLIKAARCIFQRWASSKAYIGDANDFREVIGNASDFASVACTDNADSNNPMVKKPLIL